MDLSRRNHLKEPTRAANGNFFDENIDKRLEPTVSTRVRSTATSVHYDPLRFVNLIKRETGVNRLVAIIRVFFHKVIVTP
jgi:hypothetical protein